MPVYKDKKSGMYYYSVSYKDIFGKQKRYKSKKYIKKEDAVDDEALFRIKNKEQPNNKITLGKLYLLYKNDYNKQNKESSTFDLERIFKGFILPYFENTRLNNLTIASIKKWQDEINNKKLKNGNFYSLRYKQNIHQYFSSFMNYAIKYYGINKNVVSLCGTFKENTGIVEKTKIKYITFEQFLNFIKQADDIIYETLFIVLYFTGIRRGELQALTWQEVDFKNKQLHIFKNLTTKTNNDIYKITNTKNNKNRKIALDDYTLKSLKKLKKYYSKYENFSENWFVFGGKRFLPQTTITRYKNNYFANAKITPITLHEFRHSHASLLINMDYNPIKIAERLGHSEEILKKVYAHLFPESQKDIVKGINNLIKKCT